MTRELGPGQTDIFTIDAESGRFLEVVARKKGVDAAVTIADPSGQPLVTAASPNFTSGPERVVWIATSPGVYTVKVAKLGRPQETGRYELEWTEARNPTEADNAQIQAQAKFYAAATKDRAGTVDSRLEALRLYTDAAALWQQLNERYEEALCLFRIGVIHAGQGEQRMALDYYQQALTLWRAIGDRSGEVLALLNISNISSAMGDPQKALDCFEQALALQRATGDRSGEGRTLGYIANVYRDLGGEEKALDYYHQAGMIAHALGERSVEADTLIGIGDVYFFQGEKKKSLDAYEQGLALKRAVGDRSGEALTLIGIANVYSDLGGKRKAVESSDPGEKQKALEYYQQALTIGRALGDSSVMVFALAGSGVLQSALGDKKKAMDQLNQAGFIFGYARYRPGEGWVQYEKARVERDRGNLAAALTLASNARQIIESLRSKMISQDLRASFLAAVLDCYGLETDILMRLHAADPSRTYQADALTASERARARILLETLSEARADIREGVDPQLLEKERDLQAQLNSKEMARIQLLATQHTAQQAADMEKAVSNLAAQYEDVRTAIRARSPRYAALNFPQPLSLSEIQKEVLDDPDTILLEYTLGEQQSFVWVVSSTEISSVVLPKRSDIEQAARSFYTVLSGPGTDATPESGKVLSRMLLGPVASHLGNKRLLIVADGALQYLPFAALPDPDGFEKPLIVNHEIVSVPSASTLAVLRRENANRKPAPKTLAVLADPVFSKDDSRLRRAKEMPVREANLALARSLNDLGLGGRRLSRLPGTRREAAGIAALVPEAERKQALDFDANRTTLTNADIGQFRILHLATHGLLNTAHPELSGLVLSLVNREGQSQDGFVRLHEVYNLRLAADLVVLSACQTGLGKEIRGEGLVGLTRGFMYAGAPRVLASLWKVDDRSTAELMKRFYGAMLGEKRQRPAAALRDAQIAAWKTKGWEAPYYWAAFVLHGDWK